LGIFSWITNKLWASAVKLAHATKMMFHRLFAYSLIALTAACWALVPVVQLLNHHRGEEMVWVITDGSEEDRGEENKEGENKGEVEDDGKKWSSSTLERSHKMIFREAWSRAAGPANWVSPVLKGILEPPERSVG
jgi:hypothetical protein